ncbi:glycoside hydrolase family 9 protein [Asticcacaulis sp. YBE204]|uniref:glycoside hydrolase family 9 protein n=1 Tax=Asticcacaulis sp. YBE204 TaxID=1282363 RepID=UPI0003C3BB79|nr:glycoside hydrolase family 9 protein [Asticcacaulis sp. YBE204]ESQ76501.1 hypothetical protein AEYBE204_19090 [Asticcacaulis sp. YBE204]
MKQLIGLTAGLAAVASGAAAQTIAVNQTGFTPASPKWAVVETEAAAALDWTVRDAAGQVVSRGRTQPFGLNKGSGRKVQQIDFSRLTTEGKGYVVVVGDATSAPFDIAPDIYKSLKYDALNFFYHQRAGVPIETRYVGERWARPKAHDKEVVTCWGPKDHRGNIWGGCHYSLDVTGGWYDAGDHGKYVVNGGIAVWTLMNAYEVAQVRGDTAFADGKAKIPEAGNGRNDLLDEARFEMDFLMSMQVPDGQYLTLPLGDQRKHLEKLKFTRIEVSGMAHHKVHNEHWTAVPTPPHLDREKRGLSYPSTAATLNLAATAAQCARVFRGIDDAYADRCLSVARKAYAAAKRVPDAYAIDVLPGGAGGYGDPDVSDEFYWAATELFVTTGEGAFERDMKTSSHFMAMRDFNWGGTAPLGTITLAIAGKGSLLSEARASIVKTADTFAAQTKGQGYHIPFDRTYSWGSTADFANRALIFELAADFTGQPQYRDEAVNLMDYLLGRNPLSFSFVSGYGERAMQHPHHRFWANDGTLPPPPPGVLSGGTNQRPSDPEAQAALKDCAPQLCYVDHIGSYSTNEVTVNWNAPLVWIAAWLDDSERQTAK